MSAALFELDLDALIARLRYEHDESNPYDTVPLAKVMADAAEAITALKRGRK